MKRIILQGFALLLMFGVAHGQIPVLSNPSQCSSVGVIQDNTCPGNGGRFDPNQFFIRVTGAPGSRLGQDVYLKEVRLIISHSWTADLDIFLLSPSGKRVMLTSDNGGGEDNYGRLSPDCTGFTSFAAVSCVPVQAGRPPFLDGPYLPEESLTLFNDGSNPVGDWTLLICDDSEQDSGYLHFVELVFDPIQCLPVQTIRVLRQDTTDLVLDWSPSEGCAGVRTFVEYGPSGFSPGRDSLPGLQGKIVEVKCPPFRLQGLPPDTELDFYIRKSCGPGSYSGNSCPVSIRTGCLPPTPLILENFSSAPVCSPICGSACQLQGIWQNTGGDDFDWLVYQGATPTQGTGPSDGLVPGGKYVYIETSGSSCTGRAMLRSGCILLNKRGTDACHVSFNYHMFGSSIGSLSLEASADGIQWFTLWSRQGDQGNQWNKVYLSLSDFADGSLLQFRFIATKGNGPLGDIALADIAFHGSDYLGMPSFRFYADRDRDGYGDAATFIDRCIGTAPPGFIERAGDCNDFSAEIHPGIAEIPCDGKDNNCNGDFDDFILQPALTTGDTVCSGEKPLLRAVPREGSVILWYDVPQGGQPLAISQDFSPVLPPNTGSTPRVYRFFAEVTDDKFRCFSSSRSEAIAVVSPMPSGSLIAPAFCRGDSIDLGTLNIEDRHLTGAVVTFHSGLPANTGNLLSNTRIQPVNGMRLAYLLTSAAGCTFSDTFSLKERSIPELHFLPADSFALCTGAFRTIEANASKGAGGYRYFWENGDTLSHTTVLGGTVPGLRRKLGLTVTDAAGCIARDSIIIITTSSMDSVFREVVDASSCGSKDGRIILRPLDGVPPFSYRWVSAGGGKGESSGVTTVPFTLNNLEQGSYRITITDSSNEKCAFVLPPTYVNGAGAQIRQIRVSAPRCAGGSDGSVCLELSPGVRASFRWSSGDTTACVQGLRTGIYTVTITDSICTKVVDSIEVPGPTALSISGIVASPSCSDRNDGSIQVKAYGGSGGYRFQWNNGFLSEGIGNLSPGQYTLTVTDLEGCTLMRQFEVTAPMPVGVVTDSLIPVACPGDKNGLLKVTGTGGTGPYQFIWENGAVSSIRTGLGSGSYKVTVSDVNGCRGNGLFEMVEPSPLKAFISTPELPKCLGDTSGVLEASGTGGWPPYKYLWNNGVGDKVLQQVGVGEYSVRVIDAAGCVSDSVGISVASPELLQWNASVLPPLCDGRSDGRIQLNPAGRGPFRFLWNNRDTVGTLTGLSPGRYSVSARDASGCRFDTAFVLDFQEKPITMGVVAIPPSCPGGKDGLLRLEPQQVLYPPLAYRWENNSTARERSGLGEGIYRVTISDGAGCRLSLDTMRVVGPSKLTHALASKGEIVCKGDSTGFLEVEIKGGVPPYNYRWIGSPSNASSAYRLVAGEYRLFVTDSKGCPLIADFTIEEPPAIRLEAEVRIGNICEGDSSNQIKALVSGGVPPYALRWNNGRTEPVLSNIPAGDYFYTIEDSNGCRQVLPSVKVRENSNPLELVQFQVRDISCFGQVDGSLSVSVRGGRPPYTYVFRGTSATVQTFQTQWNLNSLSARSNYAVVVSDAQGCRVESAERVLREPPLLSVRRDSIQLVNCTGPNSGAIFITANGGTPPYAFNWFDEASGREIATTEDLISFKSGNYRVVVTDSRVCSDTLSEIHIPVRSTLKLEDTHLTPIICKGDSTGRIEVRLSGGHMPYRYFWNGKAGGATLENIPGGSYTLEVTDADSCTAAFPVFQVTEPALAITAQGKISPVKCAGEGGGAIQAEVSGTQGIFQSIWRDQYGVLIGRDSLKIEQLKAGRYQLQVKDEKGCSAAFDYVVGAPEPIRIQWISKLPGEQGNPGTLEAKINGGSAPYRFLWSTGDTTSTLSGPSPGTYWLSVTDANGCIARDSFRLQPTAILNLSGSLSQGKIFPNPATNSLMLELEFTKPLRQLYWRLTDLNGREVGKGTLPEGYQTRKEIRVDALFPSIYVIEVLDPTGCIWRARWMKL